MKIYTRTGDDGNTGLFGGGRVQKAHVRVEAYGTLDELNAALGVCVESTSEEDIQEWLIRIQRDLFSLGASLATPKGATGETRPSTPPLPVERVREMEGWIDTATDETPELGNFILPGGSRGAAALHLARTICRRAERAAVRLMEKEEMDPGVVRYLNRLSDLLFAAARLENWRKGLPDLLWEGEEA